jgi:hypothetical protein
MSGFGFGYEDYPEDAEGDIIVTEETPSGTLYKGFNPAALEGRNIVAVDVHRVPMLLTAYMTSELPKEGVVEDPNPAKKKRQRREEEDADKSSDAVEELYMYKMHTKPPATLTVHADVLNFRVDFPDQARRLLCKIITNLSRTLKYDSIVATIVSGYYPADGVTPSNKAARHMGLVKFYNDLGFTELVTDLTGGGDTLMLVTLRTLKTQCSSPSSISEV